MPLFVAIHIINIETGRTEASINQVVSNSNYILAIIRLNLDFGVECFGVIEVLCLLVDDFNRSRETYLGIIVSLIQIETNNLTVTNSQMLCLARFTICLNFVHSGCVIYGVTLGCCNNQVVGVVVVYHAVFIVTSVLFQSLFQLNIVQWLLDCNFFSILACYFHRLVSQLVVISNIHVCQHSTLLV